MDFNNKLSSYQDPDEAIAFGLEVLLNLLHSLGLKYSSNVFVYHDEVMYWKTSLHKRLRTIKRKLFENLQIKQSQEVDRSEGTAVYLDTSDKDQDIAHEERGRDQAISRQSDPMESTNAIDDTDASIRSVEERNDVPNTFDDHVTAAIDSDVTHEESFLTLSTHISQRQKESNTPLTRITHEEYKYQLGKKAMVMYMKSIPCLVLDAITSFETIS